MYTYRLNCKTYLSFSLANDPPKVISHYPDINWGRGRLMPYESSLTISMKLCKLNNISYQQLSILISSLVGRSSWYRFVFNNLQCNRLSKLLDENVSVVRTLSADFAYLPGMSGTFYFDSIGSSYDIGIRYCPVCIQNGYISVFHECGWIQKCPLHGVDIIDKRADCSSGSYNWKRIQSVISLLSEIAPNWHIIKNNNTLLSDFSSVRFKVFLKWLRSAHVKRKELLSQNSYVLLRPDCPRYNFRRMIDQINWFVEIPELVREIIGCKIDSINPKVIHYGLDDVTGLMKCLESNSVYCFPEFYRTTISLAGMEPDYVKLIKGEISDLMATSKSTPGGWGYNRSIGWRRVSSDGWPHYGHMTVFAFAADILYRKWILPWRDSDSSLSKDRDWIWYCSSAKHYVSNGFPIKPLSDDWFLYNQSCLTPYFSEIVDINISSDVRSVFESVLFEEAKLHIEVVRSWLTDIIAGESPEVESYEAASRANLFICDRRADLIIWPN